ncbi:hypothetical protein EYZ11_002973 [Aspergillus tanneri]|uniref:Uncharacterized protein n=1 Tax=Aspergillus tanneri TaxID=1220188 RepID=A0A4S3JQ39_9EURO|nr:hypothetical protein EYZ11_002973 [Aspergillus tanneri]
MSNTTTTRKSTFDLAMMGVLIHINGDCANI